MLRSMIAAASPTRSGSMPTTRSGRAAVTRASSSTGAGVVSTSIRAAYTQSNRFATTTAAAAIVPQISW